MKIYEGLVLNGEETSKILDLPKNPVYYRRTRGILWIRSLVEEAKVLSIRDDGYILELNGSTKMHSNFLKMQNEVEWLQ